MADQTAHGAVTQILMFSTTWCGDCRRSKRWLDTHGIGYDEIDVDADPAAEAYITQLNHGLRRVPTIVFPDGSVLVEPSNDALAAHIARVLGIMTPDAERALSR